MSNSSFITLDMHGYPKGIEYLSSSDIKKGPNNFLFPAVTIAGPCYTSITYKVTTDGTEKVDYIDPVTVFRCHSSVARAGHLRMYGANWYLLEPAFYGITCLNMSQGESLTHAINMGISSYANPNTHNFGDETSWIEYAKTNYFGYLLYGDPAYKPIIDDSIPPIISPSSKLLNDKMNLNIKFNHNVTLFTPGHIEELEWYGLAEAHGPMKIRVLLPNDLIVKEIKLLNFTDPTNKIKLSFLGWIEERWLDEKFLYLYLSFGFPDIGRICNGTIINLEISVNEPETGRIKVILKDSSGATISGASVSSTSQPGGQTAVSRISSAVGSATFSSVAPGNYVMQASKPGYYSSSGTVSVLAGSMVELTLKLQAVLITGDLRVTVKDSAGSGVSGASLSSTSQPGGQDAINGMSNADGVVVFKDILSGSYTLQA